MRKRFPWLLVVLFILLFLSNTAFATGEVVYRLTVEGQIDNGMVRYLNRGLEEAEKAGASLVVLEMNTPGGYLESAEAIGSLLEETDIPTVAFINRRALSAGSYLALCCDYIYMAPGSTMGAAEARTIFENEPADEKVLSSWEGAMRSAAESKGRDPLLAAAMVRRGISVPSLVEKGELLVLTPEQAFSTGYSEGTVRNLQGLLEDFEMETATLREVVPTFNEKLSGFLTNPIVATLLLTVGIAALVIELFTAGFGGFGAVSLIAFVLYFGGSLMAGQSGYEAIIFFVLGLLLLLIEAFIPGFGVFGISGLVSLVTAIVLAAASAEIGLYMLLFSIVAAGIIIWVAFRFLEKRGFADHIILRDVAGKDRGYTSHSDYSDLEGKQGESITPLRPAGAAVIEGKRIDVVTQGEYIPSATGIKVVATEGGKVIVKKAD